MKTDDSLSHNDSNLSLVESDVLTSNNKSRQHVWRKLLAAIALVALGAGVVMTENYLRTGSLLPSQSSRPQSIVAPTTPVISASPPAAILLNFITQVVNQVGPAVVLSDYAPSGEGDLRSLTTHSTSSSKLIMVIILGSD